MKTALSWLSNNKTWLFGGIGTTVAGAILAFVLAPRDHEPLDSATISVERFEDLVVTDTAVRNLFEAMGETPPPPEKLDSKLRAIAALVISLNTESQDKSSDLSADRERTASVSLQLPFEYDSAVLSKEAKGQLDYLATALQSDILQQYRFSIVGHTDAVGSEAYNQALSERQAEAIRVYLIRKHGIEPDRLMAVGRGESDLLDPAHPESARNRRIEVINLGG